MKERKGEIAEMLGRRILDFGDEEGGRSGGEEAIPIYQWALQRVHGKVKVFLVWVCSMRM